MIGSPKGRSSEITLLNKKIELEKLDDLSLSESSGQTIIGLNFILVFNF